MRIRNQLLKKARKGFRGYPVATVAHYGPDADRASKVVVSILTQPDEEASVMKKWYSEISDIRFDNEVIMEILDMIREHHALSITMPDRIIGCPHEERTDYPQGETCPLCPYWAGKDRWSGV